MKREILFKALRADGNCNWTEGYLIEADGKCFIMPWALFKDNTVKTCFTEVIPETVCQYTGLKDKNGEKIFEGDIVRFHYFYGGLGSNLGFEEREHEMIGHISSDEYGWILNAIEGEYFEGCTGFDPKEGDCSFLHLHEFSNGQSHEESFELTGKNIHDEK